MMLKRSSNLVWAVCSLGLIAFHPIAPSTVQAQVTGAKTDIGYLGALEEHFTRARSYWLQKEDALVSMQLKQANEFFQLMVRVTEDGLVIPPENSPARASKLMEDLRTRLDGGGEITLRELHLAASETHLTLAAFHRARALVFIRKNQGPPAAYALQLAFNHAAYAAGWSGFIVGVADEANADALRKKWNLSRSAIYDLIQAVEKSESLAEGSANRKTADQLESAVDDLIRRIRVGMKSGSI